MSQEWIERTTVLPQSNGSIVQTHVHVHVRDGVRLILVERQRVDSAQEVSTVLDRALQFLRDHPERVLQIRQATSNIDDVPNQRLAALVYIRNLRANQHQQLLDPIETDSDNSAVARYIFSDDTIQSRTAIAPSQFASSGANLEELIEAQSVQTSPVPRTPVRRSPLQSQLIPVPTLSLTQPSESDRTVAIGGFLSKRKHK